MPKQVGSSVGSMSATTTSTTQDRPLNPALRPQRLYLKVELAMKAVDKKLSDRSVTAISDWLSVEEMKGFRRTVRNIIRQDYDATMDSWPKRVIHDYVPDARRAIIQAINDNWLLFEVTEINGNEGYDEHVPGELLLPRFYTE
ncbi:hypothetical protein G7054_g9114 [Neopestalotiopsis clavispora]|nr:hypothetical protein G7054_g9114 [Neopestalotiopsis clavispora]